MVSPVVTTRNLTVRYGSGPPALEEVSLAIMPGRLTAVIGPNGSGKSTLLKAILGLIPYSGEVTLHCSRREVGFVPQKLSIGPGIPASVAGFVAALIGFRPLVFGIGNARRERVRKILSVTGAEHLMTRPLSGLSGGEMQRVLLALALEPTPRLLLLDEPASGMDVASEQRLYETVQHLIRHHNTAVVMVSHDLSVVSDLTDHVLCVNQRLMCEGSAKDVLTDRRIAEVFGHHHGVYVHRHPEEELPHGHHAGPCSHPDHHHGDNP